MASSKDYQLFILGLLREVSDISCRPMMGEYILYQGSTILGGIYDNRFLIKKSEAIEKQGFKEAIPYPKGKPMYLLDSENKEEVASIVLELVRDSSVCPF